MSGEELYNADVAKHPTYLNGKPRTPWNKLGPIFRTSWEMIAAELTPPCDFCGQSGHADTPCPVRHESAVRHAEEGAKAYPPATGVEAMVCDVVAKAVLVEGMTEEIGGVISREIAARQRLGIVKYGTTLADNRATLPVRLRHALEESLDLAVYAQWAMEAEDAAGLLPSLAGIRGVALIVAERLLNVMATTEGGQP
jgi:hypothetical protein